jgi:tRNA(adenine34) deaminase
MVCGYERRFMQEALAQAHKAFLENEIPIGAVIVYQDRILCRAYNQMQQQKKSWAHAEFLILEQAHSLLKTPYLSECFLYVTLEPCLLCSALLHTCRIGGIFFGAYNPKKGGLAHGPCFFQKSYTPAPIIIGGILQSECEKVLDLFFKTLR